MCIGMLFWGFQKPHSNFDPLWDVGLRTGPIGGLSADGNISRQRRKNEKRDHLHSHARRGRCPRVAAAAARSFRPSRRCPAGSCVEDHSSESVTSRLQAGEPAPRSPSGTGPALSHTAMRQPVNIRLCLRLGAAPCWVSLSICRAIKYVLFCFPLWVTFLHRFSSPLCANMMPSIKPEVLLILLLYPFNGLFHTTTWVSWHQKGKTSLDLNEARNDGVWGCSGISWTICKQSAPRTR